MSVTIRPEKLANAVSAYFALLTLVLAAYLWHDVRHLNGWAIADWLINYQGGFVRRGLLGQVVFLAGRATHTSPAYFAAGIQLFSYAALVALISRLLKGLRWSFAWLALLLSPATLEFPIFDPAIALKKEFLLFATLAGLIYYLNRNPKLSATVVWSLTVVLIAVALTHELTLIYAPYFLAPLFFVERDWRRVLRLLALPVLLLGVVALLILKHPGNTESAHAICTSLGGTWPGDAGTLCSGAIYFYSISASVAQVKALMATAIREDHYFRTYIPAALLTLLPFAFIVRRLVQRGDRRRELRWIAAVATLSLLASLQLFLLASDWGRWIHIHAVCGMLLLLMVDRDRNNVPPQKLFTPNRRSLVPALAVLLYATCWTLPGLVYFPGRFGVIDVARYLTHYDTTKKGH